MLVPLPVPFEVDGAAVRAEALLELVGATAVESLGVLLQVREVLDPRQQVQVVNPVGVPISCLLPTAKPMRHPAIE